MDKSIQIVRAEAITPEGKSERNEAIAVEEPLEIRVGYGAGDQRRSFSLAVTMRTPGADEDLAVGFLFTEGIIQRMEQIIAIKWLADNTILVELSPGVAVDEVRFTRHLFTSSSCGVCGKASLDAVQTVACFFPQPGLPNISSEWLISLPQALRKAQTAFDATGGIHAAGIFQASGNLIVLREDIGRHNAVDKAIGAILRAGIPMPLNGQIMLVSGRAGFELVQKAAMAGIPVLAAVGAPSSLATELAANSGMTLVGFLRGERFNVYTVPERIKTQT